MHALPPGVFTTMSANVHILLAAGLTLCGSFIASHAFAQAADTRPAARFVREDTSRVLYEDRKPYVVKGVKVFSDNSVVDHGIFTRFFRNGQKAEEGQFVDGKKHGPWKLWCDNG